MKILWYIVTILLVILILLQNPKKESFKTFGFQNQTLSNTRESEKLLQNITWIGVILFVILTSCLAL
uniref:preprotein translocase subunit G n=1 Tax=Rhodella violacea TaxID=2801 RepID=UPI001FCCD8EC|nr:preprotein translocase subunit G [Rhodella violacea]UNJ18147.1 preprotein translocase subunit G [Rhodella violacea]